MAMIVFLTTAAAAFAGLALLAVGIFWRTGGKTVRLAMGIIGGLIAVGNLGVLVFFAYTMATASSMD